MFKSKEELDEIFFHWSTTLSMHSTPRTSSPFLSRKPAPDSKANLSSTTKTDRLAGGVKFKLNSNHVKSCNKSNYLRIELTINDPREFKVFKDIHHEDGTTSKGWGPMGKSISNLYRYFQVGWECDNRMLPAMEGAVPAESVWKELEKICESHVNGNRRTTAGINLWRKDNYKLLKVISDGRYIQKGFRNYDIKDQLYPGIKDEKKRSSKTTRTLRMLRKHQLAGKANHSSRYYLTKSGRRICNALIYIWEYMYPQTIAKFN